MTADDLTRRAIIAAHDVSCGCNGHDEDTHYPPLSRREGAIVAAWRADREDYQGRYEIAHERKVIANAALAAAAKEQQRAETAGAAIERVRAIADNWYGGQCISGYLIPNGDDTDGECLHCVADVIVHALDGVTTDV